MQDQPSGPQPDDVELRGGSQDPFEQDRTLQAAIVSLLLTLHPAQLTVDELAREMHGPSPGFSLDDAVVRCVEELAGSGVLNRSGELVLLSRSSVRLGEVMEL